MTSGEQDAEFFQERGFGLTMGFGERPAILVVDLVKAFTDPANAGGRPRQPDHGHSIAVGVAHDRGIPVIFSTVRYDDVDLRDAGIWALKQKGSVTLRAETDGHELDPRLTFAKGDSLLLKKYASCFFGTDLVSQLNSRRIDTLIIAGCTTSGCVRATAVDAIQNGFRPIVVREAVGDRSVAAHEQSLFDLHAKYADVVALEEAQGFLRRIGHNQSQS